ncbi:MAG: hypothetical protein ONB37_01910 [candidate division KSB1 bacterium]|nr:hypothetical protein [candidate division KSB1 bacterium]
MSPAAIDIGVNKLVVLIGACFATGTEAHRTLACIQHLDGYNEFL